MPLSSRLGLLLIVGLALAVGSVVWFDQHLRRGFEELTAERTAERAEFVRDAVALQGGPLRSLVASYSWWDDMLAFMRQPDPTWAAGTIDHLAGMPNGGDAVWVVDTELNLVHTIDADYARPGLPFSDPAGMRNWINARYEFDFFTVIEGHVWQVFGAAIQDPSFWRHETPVLGYLLLGKRWDQAWLTRLGGLSQSRLVVQITPPAATPQPDRQFDLPLVGPDATAAAILRATFDQSTIERLQQVARERALLLVLVLSGLIGVAGLGAAFGLLRPLGQIIRSLESRNPAPLADLINARSEWGEVARLLSSQFRQGRMLQDEIRRRLPGADGEDARNREGNDAVRLRLASDLHDGPLQSLYAAGLKVGTLEAALAAGRPPDAAQLAAVRSILTECSNNLRNLLLDLEPEELRDQDLEDSLRRLERYLKSISRLGHRFLLEEGTLDGLSRPAQLHLYYITRELVSNAARHARPDHTALELRRRSGFLVLRWENDGFNAAEVVAAGNGLRNIGTRVQQLDGTWSYQIHRAQTWRVTIELPYTALSDPGSGPLGPVA